MLNKLRPSNFKEYIGQKRLKSSLKVIIESASKRKKSIDHILLHGASGLGKTSLATVLANESGSSIRYAQGPLFEKKADVLALLGSIRKNDIIFIDEIHAINKNIEELLFSAIEDFVVDITIGMEGDSKIVRIKLPPFTLIGATTKLSLISKPLKDRFGLIAKISGYEKKDISRIIKQAAIMLGVTLDEQSLEQIVIASHLTPRIAINILKRVNDFAVVESTNSIDEKLVLKTLRAIGLYKEGLNDQHLDYLKALQDNFNESYTSIDVIAGILQDSKQSIEKDIEPLLLQKGLIIKTSRGRKLSTNGFNYLLSYNL